MPGLSEADVDLLRTGLAALDIPLVHHDLFRQLMDHAGCQLGEILILVEQGSKPGRLNVIREVSFTGPLPDQVRQAWDFVRALIRKDAKPGETLHSRPCQCLCTSAD